MAFHLSLISASVLGVALVAFAAPFQCTVGERVTCTAIVVPSAPLPTASFNLDIEVNYAFTQQLVRDSPGQEVQASFQQVWPGNGPSYLIGGLVSTSGRTGEALGDLVYTWRGKDIPGDLVPFWHVNSSSCSRPDFARKKKRVGEELV
ncbi:hypothetical protein PM082_006570 [Marasmius tenuissimus]|nr:hypothetical protein PM082_006570 [Marasmius tenuissimus]